MNIEDIKKINKTVVQDDGNLVSFDKQLIKLMSGVYDTNYPMIMAYNSNCLNYINSNNIENPLIINVSTVIKIKEKHDIGYEFVSECEHYLKDSVLAFNSLKHDTSNVILLNEFSEENEPIIAVCRYDKQIGCTTVNEVTSVYDRNHFENFVVRTFNAEKTFYKNKKTEQYFKSHWSRLPDDLKYALSTNYDRTSFTKCQVEQDLKNQQKKLEHIEEKNERKETIMGSEEIKELRESAKSNDSKLQQDVASNENLSVRKGLFENKNTPPKVLAELAKNANKSEQVLLAKNENTPPEVLQELAKDENVEVRQHTIRNPNYVATPAQSLTGSIAGMKKEAIKKVAESKAKNQSVPKKDLSR